jgi:hypothetical protein
MLDSVPKQLRDRAQWVAWAPDPDTERPKCPMLLRNKAKRASTRKPATWNDWTSALIFAKKYGTGPTEGVGFVFTSGLIYVDVDDCIDGAGKLRSWAAPFVKPFLGRSYIEVSPGGKGLHIIGEGVLPASGVCGGKANFPAHATGEKVPEVAMFQSGKYTTITGKVWNGNTTIRDVTGPAAIVWEAAGIKAQGVDALAGPAPDAVLPPKSIPKPIRIELEKCTAGQSTDRSAARFGFYAQALRELSAEDVFAAILESGWYEGSGASEKGRDHTWADICRTESKLEAERAEQTAQNATARDEHLGNVQVWKSLGLPIVKYQAGGQTYFKVAFGLEAMVKTLTRHESWKGRIRRNKFRGTIELDGNTIGEHASIFSGSLRAILDWDMEPPINLVFAAVAEAADANGYDPMQDYLTGLVWDGTPRAGDWLVKCGAEDSKATRELGYRWILQLVARALKPGCKADCILVLEGAQGLMKSTLFNTLAGGYFTDAHVDLDRDGLMVVAGHWIVELSELSSIRRAETEAVKAFLSRRDDTFRPPYGRATVSNPRHYCIVGSTNAENWLSDPTGNRRFWPVSVTERLNVKWLEDNRDQLLAEAVAHVCAGEPWWFVTEPDWLEERREERIEIDPLEDSVLKWANARKPHAFQLSQLLNECGLKLDDRSTAFRVSNMLKRHKFKNYKITTDGYRIRVWRHISWPSVVGSTDEYGPYGQKKTNKIKDESI